MPLKEHKVEIDLSTEGVNLDHLISPNNACMLRWELSRRLQENA